MVKAKQKVKVSKKKSSLSAGSQPGEAILSTEISDLVQSLATEADEIGEEWATAADVELQTSARKRPKTKAVSSAPVKDEDVRVLAARRAAAAEEEAEILDDSSEEAAGSPKKKKKTKLKRDKDDIDLAAGKKKSREAAEVPASQKKDGQVFLSGLPFSVDEATLRADFEKFGEISRLYFHRDAGKPLGTASIFYKTQDMADKVMLLDGIEYKGRTIKVKRRPPRQAAGTRTKAARAAQERMPEWKKN